MTQARHGAIPLLVGLCCVSPWGPAALPYLQAAVQAAECTQTATLGHIVAAEYIRRDNRLFVYATLPEPGLETVLHVDDISLLTRGQLCCGEYGFSLDFIRSDGATPFRVEDIVSPEDLVKQVREDQRAVTRLLRQRLSGEVLRKIEGGGSPDARVIRELTGALNQLRTGPDLAALTDSDVTAPGTTERQRNHHFLEDAYPTALRRQLGPRYEIRYPGAHEATLKSLFNRSRLEATFNAVDTTLKRLLNDVTIAAEAGVGATDPLLCGAELEQWAIAGALPPSWFQRSNRYYDLRPRTRFERLRGSGIRFDDPTLLVLAGDGVADCLQESAANLTKQMPALVKHPAHGYHLRRLQAALILNKVVSWASALLVPIDIAHLERVPTVNVVYEPPLVVTIPTIVAGLKSPRGTAVSGGLRLGASPGAHADTVRRLAATPAPGPAPLACFVTERTQFDGKDHLRIDVSGILGLRPLSGQSDDGRPEGHAQFQG